MKIINYIFIGILLVDNLYCMKRNFSAIEEKAKIYGDEDGIEEGLNPDSEHSVSYNFLSNFNDNAANKEFLHIERTNLPDFNNNYTAVAVTEEPLIQGLPIVTSSILPSEDSNTKKNVKNTDALCLTDHYKVSLIKDEGSELYCRVVKATIESNDRYNSTEDNKITGLDVKIKEKKQTSLSDIKKMRGVFTVDENIAFKKNYYNSLFRGPHRIEEVFHSVPPQLIALMIRYAKKWNNPVKGEIIIRRVFGVLCMPFYKSANLSYEIKNAYVITCKDDIISHISFEKPSDNMSARISYLHQYMSNNSDYINSIVQENLIYCSRQIITSKDATKKASIPLKQNQKSVIAMPVKELSAFGYFPNIIIKGNEPCPKSKDDFLYFPLSYKEPIAFITTLDWMQESQ